MKLSLKICLRFGDIGFALIAVFQLLTCFLFDAEFTGVFMCRVLNLTCLDAVVHYL
jgi:hypothetical protein